MTASDSPIPRKVGDALPVLTRAVPQERVDAYAEAANDRNPIHLDEAYAAGTQFKRRIAHGMLTLAMIAEVMAVAFPDAWARGGRLKARFKSPVFCGDTVMVYGEVASVAESDGRITIECKVGLKTSGGEEAITGQAWVSFAS